MSIKKVKTIIGINKYKISISKIELDKNWEPRTDEIKLTNRAINPIAKVRDIPFSGLEFIILILKQPKGCDK